MLFKPKKPSKTVVFRDEVKTCSIMTLDLYFLKYKGEVKLTPHSQLLPPPKRKKTTLKRPSFIRVKRADLIKVAVHLDMCESDRSKTTKNNQTSGKKKEKFASLILKALKPSFLKIQFVKLSK